jgi:hypothetical protein
VEGDQAGSRGGPGAGSTGTAGGSHGAAASAADIGLVEGDAEEDALLASLLEDAFLLCRKNPLSSGGM